MSGKPLRGQKSQNGQSGWDRAGIPAPWAHLLAAFEADRTAIGLGGGPTAIERQHAKKRMTARERIAALVDPGTEFLELGRFAAWKMYEEWGSAPAASLICGLARVAGPSF